MHGEGLPPGIVVANIAEKQMSLVVARDVFPILEQRAGDTKFTQRLTRAGHRVEHLPLAAAVIVRPKHRGIFSADHDAGTFRDARMLNAADLQHIGRDLLWLGRGIVRRRAARGQQRKHQWPNPFHRVAVIKLYLSSLCLTFLAR